MRGRDLRWTTFGWVGSLTLMIVIGSGLSGCASSENVQEIETRPRRTNPVNEDYLDFRNHPELADKLFIEQINRREGSVPMLIQLDLVNDSDETVEFDYKARWFDPDGIAVSNPTETWRWAKIRGRERVSLKLVAPNAFAQDWRIVLKQ